MFAGKLLFSRLIENHINRELNSYGYFVGIHFLFKITDFFTLPEVLIFLNNNLDIRLVTMYVRICLPYS